MAHERNVYKTIAVVSNTKALIRNVNMNSLQELRGIQKPDSRMEDILAAVIMICNYNNNIDYRIAQRIMVLNFFK